jgi:hypothetical protein
MINLEDTSMDDLMVVRLMEEHHRNIVSECVPTVQLVACVLPKMMLSQLREQQLSPSRPRIA